MEPDQHYSPLLLLVVIFLVWLAQGWIFPAVLLAHSKQKKIATKHGSTSSSSTTTTTKSSRPPSLVLLVVSFVGVTFWLAAKLQESLKHLNLKAAVFILVWYPAGIQILKYLHILSIGIDKFVQDFRLLADNNNDDDRESSLRIRIFILSTPTVIFRQSETTRKKKNDDDPIFNGKNDKKGNTNDNDNWHHIRVAFGDMAMTAIICAITLFCFLQQGIHIPNWLQRIIRVYIMGFATSMVRIVHECPVRYWILSTKKQDLQIERIISIYDQPYLTKSPRELWRRWSLTAGFHLRKGFYDPLLVGDGWSRPASFRTIAAAGVPFFVNTVLHMTWWSVAIKGEMEYYTYWNILFAYPLISFALQDAMSLGLFGTKRATTWSHHVANFVLLWIGFYWIGEPMSSAHALNSNLEDVCRANLLLPPLER